MDWQNYTKITNNLSQKLFSWAKAFSSAVPSINTWQWVVANSTPASTYPNLNTSLKWLWALTTNFWESTRYEKFHPGIDLANKIWTPIPSFSDWIVERIENNKSWFWNSVLVKDNQWNELRYSHLKQAYVKPWQKITKGTQIGAMGNTGSTYSNSGWTWSHLDLRIMNAYKKYINPFTYINQKW